MSLEVIVLIILLSSFLILVYFVFKKIPALVDLQQKSLINPVIEKSSLKSRIENFINKIPFIKSFSFNILLQKIISQIRVLTLKADHKTAGWLKMLRQKTQKKKLDDENYWEEIRGVKNNKNQKKQK